MKNFMTFFMALVLVHKYLYNQMFKVPVGQADFSFSLSILAMFAIIGFWGLIFFLIVITISLLNGTFP